ncbi:FimV/HubP family polar landmark protein [uncultured Dechloromonas sp.]|uniref:FimV/HubP family polar landmark protein n=1 Tax=uncultured Dechloromonas sp. TaxID=171719 RepID=UPI0025FDB6DE|nr:FimV/HubP family polar landmark protein [uncultured Dechloromonas sp.]
MRAELDIGATKDELAGMSARLAPQDAFRQAGVDFASVLLDLRFAVEKRPGGQAVVKVSSSKPINEPFLDFLVELNWPAGRLVREYTFLLDPPEIAARQTSRPVAEARIVETVRGGGAAEERPAPVRAAPRPAAVPKVAAEPKPRAESGNTRVVESGDTLRKIADETRHDGVTLEQMLVGLFQSNPDAFIAQNVNRLKAGAILNIPEKAAVESVSPAEARKIYVAQTSDWNNYRQKLAASTAKTPAKADEGGAQSSSGKITAKVEEKAAPADQAKDQLKVARTDAAAKGAAAAKAAETAEQVARDKALKDAQERMAVLEKNVGELQKLLEMKSQKLAELQQAPKKEEPKPVEPPKPAPKVEEPPKPVEVPKPVEPPKAAEEPKPVEAPKPAEVKPAAPAKPVEPAKAVTPPVPAPVEEPGIVDSLMEDPLPLVGGGGVLALLAAYFVARRRRTQGSSVETTAAPMPSSLGPNSVFRMTGGQSVDTGNTPPQTGDFSQTGPGTIDTDEVDPVAEADVYMAYGRDTQAEEILLEALQKDPQRTAIHAKLLEIYANRRSLKQFETLASELYAQTAGVGPDWEKVALLGAALDPGNPLYGGSPSPAAAVDSLLSEPEAVPEIPSLPESFAAEPVVEAVPPSEDLPDAPVDEPSAALHEIGFADGVERDTMVIAKEPLQPGLASEPTPVVDNPADNVDGMTLDFDLGEATVAPEFSESKEASAEEAALQGGDALDFDLAAEFGEPEPQVQPLAEPEPVALARDESPADSDAIDFDLNMPEESLLEQSSADVPAPDFSPEGTLVMPSASVSEDFDVGLGTWVGVEGQGVSVDTTESADAATDPSLTRTVVNSLAGTDTFVGGEDLLNFGRESSPENLTSTVVNTGMVDSDALEFDVKLSESVFLGEPMTPPEFDIGSINLDLSAQPEPVPEAPAAPLAEPAAPSAAAAPVQDAQWEEVNTKLDLAKAYEEMGDLEGARELLQEVVSEGPVDLVEQAKTILGRIAG